MIKNIWITAVVLLALTGITQDGLAQTEIRLRDREVQCFESTVRISDVATVRANTRSLEKAIGNLDIDSLEAEGSSLFVTREQVRIRLLLANFKYGPITFAGSESVRVSKNFRANFRKAIEEWLQHELAKIYSIPVEDLQVILDSKFRQAAELNVDTSRIRINQDLATEIPLGRNTLSLAIESDNGEFSSIQLPVSIALVQELVVAKKVIPRGTAFTEKNVEQVRRPVSDRNLRGVSLDHVLGKTAQTDIQKYMLIKPTAVRSSNVRNNYTVKKNSLVNVLVRRGSITVVLKDARAMANGETGSRIPFKNPNNNEQIIARVVDARTAEIR